MANIPRARDFAERLQDLGCQFALDDFGAGFGSFYYLKHLPFDYLKIDGEFVRNCVATRTDQLVIQAVVQIARGLGKRTVAEFVGDDATLALLRRHGVDFAQGFHVGEPAPVESVAPPLEEIASAVLRSGGGACGRGELLEGAAQQARDVHLRDADARGDLRLREVLLEAKPQDLLVARGEGGECGRDGGTPLRQLVCGVLLPEALAERVLVPRPPRPAEGSRGSSGCMRRRPPSPRAPPRGRGPCTSPRRAAWGSAQAGPTGARRRH